MAVYTSAMRFIFLLLSLFVAHFCDAASHTDSVAKDIDEPYECSQKIRQLLRDPLSNSPDFKTIHEMTKWVEQRIPSQLSARFIEAGRTVSRTLEDWERHGMIHGPFWNTQALSELLIAQSDHFVGLAGCSKQDEFGVTFQVLKDQLYIPLNVESKPVESGLRNPTDVVG